MSMVTFLVLTVLGMIIGAFASYITHKLLIIKMRNVIAQSGLEVKNESKVLHTKAEDVLKKHLEEVIKTFKEQIPMVSLFLSQGREDSLKVIAFEELSKAIPAIAGERENTQKLKSICSEELVQRFYAPKRQLMALGALIGGILGILEFIVLFFLNR